MKMHYDDGGKYSNPRHAIACGARTRCSTQDKRMVTCKRCQKILGLKAEEEKPRASPETRARIRDMLTGLFGRVEEQFRADEVAAYRKQAEDVYAAFIENVKGEGTMYVHIPRYVQCNLATFPPSRLSVRKKLDKFEPAYKRAERDAHAAVDGAKQHFIHKQAGKIESAVKDKPVKSIRGHLSYHGVITGQLVVTMESYCKFRLEMSMIVNHRYVPNFVSFYQYPARFKDVLYGRSKTKNAASEKWMKENF